MELATAKQMREMDRIAIEERGIPSLTLMERAAEGLAAAAEDLAGERADGGREKRLFLPEARGEVVTGEGHFPYRRNRPGEPRRAAVFVGSGNNGGDGTAAAGLLRRRGWQVRVFLAGSREKLTGDHREMVRRLEELGGVLEDFDPASGEQAAFAMGADVLVDALFGVGLNAPLRQPAASAVALMNQSPAPTVSADIPSGVEADTGRVLGYAVEADVTVTFSLAKIGLFVGEGALRAGKVLVWDIGIPADILAGEEFPAAAVDLGWAAAHLPRRPEDGHKGTFGKVCILAGSADYAGAPVLAARGAARSGCGLVFLEVPEGIWPAVAARCLGEIPQALPAPEGFLGREALDTARERLAGCQAALLGPGMGRAPETAALLRHLAEEITVPLVLDADGINALEGHIDVLEKRRGRVTVLTPHDGEFARLGGDAGSEDRLAASAAFAAAHGCVLVRKGHRTIVAGPDGRCLVNTTGGSGLAKGGSGDVLAGLVASLLAQGMEPVEAAALAVWIHGRAGDLAQAEGTAYAMAPEDLPEAFPRVFRELIRTD